MYTKKCSLIILVLLLMPIVSLISQNVKFNYDNCGNRTSRKLEIFKLTDTLIPVLNNNFDELKLKLNKPEISIFPNPAKDVLNIKYECNDIKVQYTLNVYDMEGKKVITKTIRSVTYNLNIRNLKKGTYNLILYSTGYKTLYKLVKH